MLGWSDDDRLCESADGWIYAVGDVTHPLVEIETLMEDEYVRAHGLSVEREHPGFGARPTRRAVAQAQSHAGASDAAGARTRMGQPRCAGRSL